MYAILTFMCDNYKASDTQDITISISNVTIRITSTPKTVQSCSCGNTVTLEGFKQISDVALVTDSGLDLKLEGAKPENILQLVTTQATSEVDTNTQIIAVTDTNALESPMIKPTEEGILNTPKKTKKSIFKTIYISILIGAITLPAMIAVYFGLSFQTVISDSMTPTVHAGDMLLSKVVPIASINPGDIALLLDPTAKLYRSHRVVSITRGEDNMTVITRGDANPNLDPPVLVANDSQTRRVVAVIPKAGFVANAFSNALADTKVKLGIFVAFILLGLANLTRVTTRYLRKRKNTIPSRS